MCSSCCRFVQHVHVHGLSCGAFIGDTSCVPRPGARHVMVVSLCVPCVRFHLLCSPLVVGRPETAPHIFVHCLCSLYFFDTCSILFVSLVGSPFFSVVFAYFFRSVRRLRAQSHIFLGTFPVPFRVLDLYFFVAFLILLILSGIPWF